jgi:hypothetical protein
VLEEDSEEQMDALYQKRRSVEMKTREKYHLEHLPYGTSLLPSIQLPWIQYHLARKKHNKHQEQNSPSPESHHDEKATNVFKEHRIPNILLYLNIPMAKFVSETWTIGKVNQERIKVFETRCWRWMLEYIWKDNMRNEEI